MSDADGALFKARSFIDLGQPQRAVDVLSEALRHDPDHVDMLAVLSRGYLLSGDDEAATEAATASQTAAGRPVLQAMIVLINVAHHRNDYHQVCELSRSVVAQWPDAPNGHIWYALGLTRLAVTDADRATVRRALATALQVGERSPDLLLNGAWIESRFGQREACLAYADEGLQADPSNADLLKLRAWAVKDSVYSAKVMMGILAIDPMDTEASRSLEATVRPRRLRLVRLLFLAPFLLAVAVLVPPTGPRAAAVVLVVTFLLLRALPHVRFLRDLPAAYVRARWRGQGRTLLTSALLVLVGTALFAVDVPVVGPFVMAAGLAGWGWATVHTVARTARDEPDGSDSQELVLRAHAGWMRSVAVQATVVGGFAWLFGHEFLSRVDAGAVAAPAFTIMLLAAVAVVTCAVVLARIGLQRARSGSVVRAVVLGIVAAGLGVVSATGVVQSTTGDQAGRYEDLPPAERLCYRGNCRDLPTVPTFTPRPAITVPSIEIPTFEPPEIPNLDPP